MRGFYSESERQARCSGLCLRCVLHFSLHSDGSNRFQFRSAITDSGRTVRADSRIERRGSIEVRPGRRSHVQAGTEFQPANPRSFSRAASRSASGVASAVSEVVRPVSGLFLLSTADRIADIFHRVLVLASCGVEQHVAAQSEQSKLCSNNGTAICESLSRGGFQ